MVEIIGGTVLQRTSYGNIAIEIPLEGIDTSSTGFGGTADPIYIYTGYPVVSAIASFEREFDSTDVEMIYNYNDSRSAAKIRVRAPIDPTILGFYIDYGQELGFNEEFVLRFNWLAVGNRKTF